MRGVRTRAALGDLEEILLFLRREHPTAYGGFSARLRLLERRIAPWPEGAAVVAGRPGVRVVPTIRCPYRLFYRVTPEGAEVLHLRHAARSVAACRPYSFVSGRSISASPSIARP